MPYRPLPNLGLRPAFLHVSFVLFLGLSGAAPAAAGGGPDLVPVRVGSIVNHGQDGDHQGYSVGVTTCNMGDAPAFFCDADSPECDAVDHPIVVANLYRILNRQELRRFEHIAMSWVRHLAGADNETNGSICGSCQAPPLGSRQLGVGCADFVTGADASARPLARRSEVNAATVTFPFPFTSPAPTTSSEQRLRVLRADIDPATNAFARYFIEVQLLAADDLTAGNERNNFVYREVVVDPLTLDLEPVGPQVSGRPAIFAWRDVDPQVQIAEVVVPGTDPVERFFVGRRYLRDFDDFDNYFYALQNVNSDLGARRWNVVFATGLEFGIRRLTMIAHHSGEPYETDLWTLDSDLPDFTELSYFTDSFLENPFAHALRWGTTFSIRFDKDIGLPSRILEESFNLYKPGPVDLVDFTFSRLPPEELFRSGFESGDTGDWSLVVP